jgi:N-carbamoylputrescine amidase
MLEQEWQKLENYVNSESSDLLLLPEMPFYPWIAQTNQVKASMWQEAVETHEQWLTRFDEIETAMIVSSRPVVKNGKYLNEGFVWDKKAGYRAIHHKYYLPDEDGWWEASWYERGEKDFSAIQTHLANVGFLICTELWFGAHAREYAMQGIDLLVCPRATGISSIDKWVAGGRTAAVVSGAYCVSSNFSSGDGNGNEWGGTGWIIEPEEGEVLGVTSNGHPFLTLEIDLNVAKIAKGTYPRYVSG